MVKKMTRNEKFYNKMIEIFQEKQLVVAIEEFTELQKELCKYLRTKKMNNLIAIAEEIADVEIMLEQLKIFFKIDKCEIEEFKKNKIARTRERFKI